MAVMNLEAIVFLRYTNHTVGTQRDGAVTVAEESTSFSGVTRPPDAGGLGFHYKWNMGWMNDTLHYMQLDPVHSKYHHHQMTFSMVYAYSENFVLPQFANLRAYYGFMWGHPGKKLLFMGNEFAQRRE